MHGRLPMVDLKRPWLNVSVNEFIFLAPYIASIKMVCYYSFNYVVG